VQLVAHVILTPEAAAAVRPTPHASPETCGDDVGMEDASGEGAVCGDDGGLGQALSHEGGTPVNGRAGEVNSNHTGGEAGGAVSGTRPTWIAPADASHAPCAAVSGEDGGMGEAVDGNDEGMGAGSGAAPERGDSGSLLDAGVVAIALHCARVLPYQCVPSRY
jgi:hypothetical protein